MDNRSVKKLPNSLIYRGLFWYEWHFQKKTHFIFLGLFAALTLCYGIYSLPAFLLFSVFYAAAAGSFSGAREDSDEFFLSLPPNRTQIFFPKLAMGIIPMLLILSLRITLVQTIVPIQLGVGLGLPIITPQSAAIGLLEFAATLSLAIAVFSLFFAAAVNRRSNRMNVAHALIIFFVLFLVNRLILPIDQKNEVRMTLFILFNLALALNALIVGYRFFLRKEIADSSPNFYWEYVDVFCISVLWVTSFLLFLFMIYFGNQTGNNNASVITAILGIFFILGILFIAAAVHSKRKNAF